MIQILIRDNYNVFILFFVILILSGCSSKDVLYYPSKISLEYRYEFDVKPLIIKTEDNINLSSVYYSKKDTNNTKTVLFFYGNSGNITTVDYSTYYLLDNGYNLLFFDYRGYGKSTGEPTPQGLNQDAITMINYAIKNYTINEQKLIIYAQSLGGAVALRSLKDIKQKDKISSIVVEGSFLSYKQMAKDKFFSLASAIVDDKYAPNQTNKNLDIPLLIIHSKDDKVVPYSQGIALHKYFKNSIFWDTQDEHIEFLNFSTNRKKLYKYLNKK